MRQIHLLGLALLAALAASATAAASASALESVWLVNGARPTSGVEVLSETLEGTAGLLLENTKKNAAVSCSGLNEGWVGLHLEANETDVVGAKFDEVTKITDLTGTSTLILCTFDLEGTTERRGSCEPEATSSPDAEAVGLPWLTELLLVEGKFLDDISSVLAGQEAGWKLTCLIGGFSLSETCVTNAASADINNTTEGDVEAFFSPTISPKANCTGPFGEKELGVGAVEGDLLIFGHVAGTTLAVSEG